MDDYYHDGEAVKRYLEANSRTVGELEEAMGLSRHKLYYKLKKVHWSAYDLQKVSQFLQSDLLARYRMVQAGGEGLLWLPDGEGLVRLSIVSIEPNTEL